MSTTTLPNAMMPAGATRRVATIWRDYRTALLWFGVLVSSYLAVYRVGYGLYRLVFWQGHRRAYDLRSRVEETRAWFAGAQVYGRIETADYPPAAYPTFWPFMGWGEERVTRWIWAVTALGALAWLAWLLVRASAAKSLPEKALVALLPFAAYSTFDTLNTGQLGLHILPPLLFALVWLHASSSTITRDAGIAALLISTLAKPTLVVPFFWIAFFARHRARVALLVIAGYAVLTLFAASFQNADVVTLIRAWLEQRNLLTPGETAANLHFWLARAGYEQFLLPTALAMLLAHGAWTYHRRDADVWLLAGVAAIVARVWMYHRPFDDLLIVVPLIAVWRCARCSLVSWIPPAAGLLAAALWVSLILPRWTLTDYPTVEFVAMQLGQPFLWVLALIVLVRAAAGGWRVEEGMKHAA